MKRQTLFISVLVVFLFVSTKWCYSLTLSDGGTYDISYTLTGSNFVQNNTTLNLITGGRVSQYNTYLKMQNTSTLNVNGGSVDCWMYAEDYSHVNLLNGEIERIYVEDSSQFNMTGGTTYFLYGSTDNQIEISDGSVHVMEFSGTSQINWTGGQTINHLSSRPVITPKINLYDSAFLTISGSDFAIDGTPVSYGTYTIDDYANGQITGTLLNGDIIDTPFSIGQSSSIVLIPEPATLVLLALGGLALRKRK
ncbi:MAG: PEP-CTERM sorting domain-containing protein [Phycisphaerae bacterium]|nr:PEP-CTERM sorting domain-containing protein [Phycisphaerae bacterium]